MEITCHHSASSYGIPVILDDDGNVMDYGPGLTAVLERLGWTRKEFAAKFGYKSVRSVDKFWSGVVPPAAILNLLDVELHKHDQELRHLRRRV